VRLSGALPGQAAGTKKKPAFGGLQTIILEENSGDRCNYAAPPHIRPILNFDNSYSSSEYLDRSPALSFTG
jgi:hypothetical protein